MSLHSFLPIALLALVLTTMSSCGKEEISEVSPIRRDLSIRSPEVGQQSIFLRYQGECASDSWEFNGDTLLVSVVENSGGLVLSESYTKGSPSYSEDGEVTYNLVEGPDHILITDRSQSSLFFFYGNDTIWKQPQHDFTVSLEGCLLYQEDGEPFVGNEIGHSSAIDVMVGQKDDVTLVSCVPGWIYDIDAFLAYDDHLEVSHTVLYGGWSPMVNGWIRMD